MKFALVTTTIHTPRALRWYRACGSARIFVVGDEKTPMEAYDLVNAIPNAVAFSPAFQDHWKCSEPIGWNSIQRRNIGFLEAVKWGADVIVSVDDDNMPMNPHYFGDYHALFERDFNGLIAMVAEGGFFDIGDFLFPRSKQRGVPHDNAAALVIESATGVRIGVAQGLCIGHPDVDAATRYVNKDTVHTISEIARAGIIVDNESRAIWNSQNTAIRRELIPAWFMWPYAGRLDDIFASVLTQRVMREHGYFAHYGLPMVFQQRNLDHSVIGDMRKEIDGYDRVRQLAIVLDNTQLRGLSIIDDCRLIWRTLSTCDWINPKTVVAANAYLDDCENVL